jgi:UBX domain-containing protein 1
VDFYRQGKQPPPEDWKGQGSSSSADAKPKFTGSGFKLGSDEVPGGKVASDDHKEDGDDEDGAETVVRTLTFWRNGFSIDDGPLIPINDPRCQEILEAINSGRAPLHLFNVKQGQQAEVRVADRKGEDFVAPKKTLKAFSGSGQRLGALVPNDKSASSAAAADTQVPAVNSVKMEVDASKPVTSVQIRLADGTRLVSKFNLTHTVSDLVKFIQASRPGAPTQFQLQTQFPTKVLSDSTQTLEQAGLKNATIFQKMT